MSKKITMKSLKKLVITHSKVVTESEDLENRRKQAYHAMEEAKLKLKDATKLFNQQNRLLSKSMQKRVEISKEARDNIKRYINENHKFISDYDKNKLTIELQADLQRRAYDASQFKLTMKMKMDFLVRFYKWSAGKFPFETKTAANYFETEMPDARITDRLYDWYHSELKPNELVSLIPLYLQFKERFKKEFSSHNNEKLIPIMEELSPAYKKELKVFNQKLKWLDIQNNKDY